MRRVLLAAVALCLAALPADANMLLGATRTSSGGGTSVGNSNLLTSLGMNLYYPAYWNPMFLYADVAQQFSSNGPVAWSQQPCCGGTAAPLDSTGAPTVAAYTFFTQTYPTAAMTLTWTGAGTISSNCSDGAITGGPTFSRTVTCTQVNSGGVYYYPNGIGLYTLSATPPVTNIHMTVPAGQTSGIFTTDFINRMATINTIRPMQTTNSAPDPPNLPQTKNWSDRTWPGSGSWAQPQGMPYEDIIAFANQTNKNIWLNISLLATDDYVCRLARLLHYGEGGDKLNTACNPAAGVGTVTTTPINTTSTVYIEFGNEIWNTFYQAWVEIWCWVNNAAPAGQTCQTGTGMTNSPSTLARTEVAKAFWNGLSGWDKLFAYQALMTKRHHDIFQQVFGANFNQVQIVFGIQHNQSSNPAFSQYVAPFNFMTTNYGAVNTYMTALADAPYVVPTDTSSVQAIIGSLNSQVAGLNSPKGQAIANDLQLAQTWGLTLVGYEAGQSVFDNTQIGCAAQRDPGMYTFYVNYYNLWKSIVGSNAVINNYVFTNVCPGTFGTLNMQSDACSPKWRALMNLTGGADCTP